MESVRLLSWSFVHVLQMILNLARRGGVDFSNPGLLREALNIRAWEALDELGRDPKHLWRLTPPLHQVYSRALAYGAGDRCSHNQVYMAAEQATSLAEVALGEVGYSWLSRRQVAAQLIYALANEIQGDPHALDAAERQSRSEAFLREFYGCGWDDPDPELQKEVEYYERQLGVLYCLRAIAVLTEHPELDLVELTRQGLMKYGVVDTRGRRVCYWCSGAPCVCGGRKGGMKARRPEITSDLVWARGLPEMDQHMVVYGVSRNSAINALAGVVRSLSEDGGEYGWINLMSRCGGTNRGIQERLGCLYLGSSRHPRMAAKKFDAEGVPLIEGLYSEAADAVVSWPCLVTQAFGLQFTRSVLLGLQHMADGAGVTLETPDDLTRTIPVRE